MSTPFPGHVGVAQIDRRQVAVAAERQRRHQQELSALAGFRVLCRCRYSTKASSIQMPSRMAAICSIAAACRCWSGFNPSADANSSSVVPPDWERELPPGKSRTQESSSSRANVAFGLRHTWCCSPPAARVRVTRPRIRRRETGRSWESSIRHRPQGRRTKSCRTGKGKGSVVIAQVDTRS